MSGLSTIIVAVAAVVCSAASPPHNQPSIFPHRSSSGASPTNLSRRTIKTAAFSHLIPTRNNIAAEKDLMSRSSTTYRQSNAERRSANRLTCRYSSTSTIEETNEVDEISDNNIVQVLSNDGDINSDNRQISALNRAMEIATILASQVMAPILTSLATKQSWPNEENGGWETFWSTTTTTKQNNSATSTTLSHAQRLALTLEKLGPTYVKFGQALGSRPDVVPQSLASALSTLQDDMEPFDNDLAKEIILAELLLREANGKEPISSSSSLEGGKEEHKQQATLKDVEALVSTITDFPVAAASIGQVYKANIPGKGDVAVKVQRPGVRQIVERDSKLLLTVASFLESLPALPSSHENENDTTKKQTRLINTELVSTTKEFMSRIFEEMDYRREANNIAQFSSLYSTREGTSKSVSVIVPKVYTELCTENVLVMEWIDGVKLTDVAETSNDTSGEQGDVDENLALVKVAIDSTLSQLLVEGCLHCDPHAGAYIYAIINVVCVVNVLF